MLTSMGSVGRIRNPGYLDFSPLPHRLFTKAIAY
jgi:hypothetical protein